MDESGYPMAITHIHHLHLVGVAKRGSSEARSSDLEQREIFVVSASTTRAW